MEQNIFAYLYKINYYDKSSREVLRGIVWSDGNGATDDWISIKEGDSSVQKVSKNSISRSLSEAANETRSRMKDLLYQYNMSKSSPIQVAGEDSFLSLPYSDNSYLRN